MQTHCCTRRRALQGAGITFLGLALLGPRVAAAAANPGADLDPVRAATLTAPSRPSRPARPPVSSRTPTRRISPTFYAAGEPPFRALGDDALDRLAPLATMEPETVSQRWRPWR